MNRQTALSLLAAGVFGIAMASASIASAVDDSQTPSQRARCERVVDDYFACVTECQGLPPSQLGSCQDACWTDDVSECADSSSSRPLNTARPARTVRAHAALQRRR
jgi:hypothetical protein